MSEIAEVDPRRSALQRGGWRRRDGGDFRWWLGGKLQFQLIQQEAELGFGLGIAGEQQLAAVGGRQVDIDHLHGGELFQHAARCQPGRQRMPGLRCSRAPSSRDGVPAPRSRRRCVSCARGRAGAEDWGGVASDTVTAS